MPTGHRSRSGRCGDGLPPRSAVRRRRCRRHRRPGESTNWPPNTRSTTVSVPHFPNSRAASNPKPRASIAGHATVHQNNATEHARAMRNVPTVSTRRPYDGRVSVGDAGTGRSPRRVADLSAPFWIAHRGMANVYPENTLEAYRGTVPLGVDVGEPDCWLTRDGGLVCLHDATVDRTTDGSGTLTSRPCPAQKYSISMRAPGSPRHGRIPFECRPLSMYWTSWTGKRSCAPRRRTPARGGRWRELPHQGRGPRRLRRSQAGRRRGGHRRRATRTGTNRTSYSVPDCGVRHEGRRDLDGNSAQPAVAARLTVRSAFARAPVQDRDGGLANPRST